MSESPYSYFMKPAYFQQPNFRLYQGDCLDILREIPDNSVDLIFADPPYNLSNGGFSMHAGKRVSVNKGDWDKSKGVKEDFDFHLQWIEACHRILKPEGTIWISGTYHSIYQCGFSLQLCGYHILNEVSWYKPNAAPNLSCRCFAASHETLIWARKHKKAKHVFHYQEMKHGDWGNDFIKNPNKQMRSVWSIGTTTAKEKTFGRHPTQKPIALLNRIVRACTNEGDLVLDPFNGSATTGIAAYALKRKYVGIEKETDFLDLSIKRFQEIQPPKIEKPRKEQYASEQLVMENYL